MKRFSMRSLFAREGTGWMENHPYPTHLSQIEAARTGAKPMSCFSMCVHDLVRGDFAREVFGRSLAIALCGVHHRPGRVANVFVARPAELWRVPANLLQWRTPRFGLWDDADDAYGSRLFGYTNAQTKRWQAYQHQRDDFCLYVLLTRAQRRRVLALGKRCLGTANEVEQLTLYYAHKPLKQDAHARVPAGLTLARVLLNSRIYVPLIHDKVHDEPREWLRTIKPSRAEARLIVEHQHANVEFLTARGWR